MRPKISFSGLDIYPGYAVGRPKEHVAAIMGSRAVLAEITGDKSLKYEDPFDHTLDQMFEALLADTQRRLDETGGVEARLAAIMGDEYRPPVEITGGAEATQ